MISAANLGQTKKIALENHLPDAFNIPNSDEHFIGCLRCFNNPTIRAHHSYVLGRIQNGGCEQHQLPHYITRILRAAGAPSSRITTLCGTDHTHPDAYDDVRLLSMMDLSIRPHRQVRYLPSTVHTSWIWINLRHMCACVVALTSTEKFIYMLWETHRQGCCRNIPPGFLRLNRTVISRQHFCLNPTLWQPNFRFGGQGQVRMPYF